MRNDSAAGLKCCDQLRLFLYPCFSPVMCCQNWYIISKLNRVAVLGRSAFLRTLRYS